jgi:hypothetical protein
MAYKDASTQTIRICRVPDRSGQSPASSPFDGSLQSGSSPASTASITNALTDSRAASPVKKVKVARPPNAFILYRKHHHPLLKAANPDLQNNDISVILGKQWNEESEQVKNEYRARAEKIKKKHADDNPGYQYAPRKSSEKKRRMTARKAAQLQANQAQPIAAQALHDQASPAEDLFSFDDDAQRFSVDLPIQQTSIDQHFEERLSAESSANLLSFDDELQQSHVVARAASSTQNDQAFLNTMIDWEGIQADADLVFAATPEEFDTMNTIETGNGQATLQQFDNSLYEAELNRLTQFL